MRRRGQATEADMAGFVQIIEFTTTRVDEVRQLGDDYLAKRQAEGTGTMPITSKLVKDRDRSNVYMNIVEFPSYDEAMENSRRAETNEFAQQMMRLCEGEPRYYNLDLVQAWHN
jgi:hypothetical protein